MAYVAVKGGERAIDNAHAWLAEARRGDPAVAEIGTAQIAEQLGRAVDRVMAEGSLYDRELAALAIKQAQGDLIEAAFLLRAYRTTLPRFAHAAPVDTDCDADAAAHFGDVQGPARRPGARPDLRLHPSPARFFPAGRRRPAAAPAKRRTRRKQCRALPTFSAMRA